MWKRLDTQYRIYSMNKLTGWVDESQYYNDLSMATAEARRKADQFRYRIFEVQSKHGAVCTFDGDTDVEIKQELYTECSVRDRRLPA